MKTTFSHMFLLDVLDIYPMTYELISANNKHVKSVISFSDLLTLFDSPAMTDMFV